MIIPLICIFVGIELLFAFCALLIPAQGTNEKERFLIAFLDILDIILRLMPIYLFSY